MSATRTQAVARAFCSTANLGAGFDVFGLALKRYSDLVSARITSGKKIRIIVRGPEGRNIPVEVKKNSAGPPALDLARKAHLKKGLEIIVEKRVPHGLGLGSSGATAAACTKVLDALLELHLSNDELVQVASLGEKAVAGTAHADNVAASLLGGFVIVYDKPVRTISLKPPTYLAVVVVTPQLPAQADKTRKARKIIPEKIGVKNAVLNLGRASAMATAFAQGDIRIIGTGMEDEIAEPYRQHLIPGYHEVKRAGLEAGAAGASISGAGPSLVAIVDEDREDPRLVAQAMGHAFSQNNVGSNYFITRPARGASIVKEA
ncbi:MAG TPA: homoserine kinase [Candidatus Angelobacter sp.]|nr:homoserine kinase [Candidatus Angelobacter sp.]